MRGLFVTGTDTGIGKTVVSALLMLSLRGKEDVCYWKPVQTGIEEDNDTETVRHLAACNNEELWPHGYRLERPLSPHLSARLADRHISVEGAMKFLADRARQKFLIVEGAGGALVPLNETELVIDLIIELGLPAVIVARTGLGTINHTLLTIEALRSRDIPIKGVIMNGVANPENRNAIEHYGKLPVLLRLPQLNELTNAELRTVDADLLKQLI